MRLIIQEYSELNKLVELIPSTRGRLQVKRFNRLVKGTVRPVCH